MPVLYMYHSVLIAFSMFRMFVIPYKLYVMIYYNES